MPYVISICHQKGGVGKTTTTLALGACFVERGIRTLVIDLDSQANLTSSIGLKSDTARFSAAEVLTREVDPSRAITSSSVPGLDIIPSSAAMRDIGRKLYPMPEYEFLLRRSLAELALHEYAAVLLDCPPSVGPLTIEALTASDLVIVPTQCEYYSIQALTDMFELIQVVREQTNPSLTYRLLVTMFDGRGKFHANMMEQLREYFQSGLFNTTIGFDTKIREAQAVGLPITTHAPLSRGASQYRQLAEELAPYVSDTTKIQTAG
jgi:chromosome partitioning protein